jgi:sugar phosphate isomerase/epimerase
VACVTLGFHAMRVCIGIGGVARGTAALKGAVNAAATLGAGVVNCYLAGMPPPLFIEAMKPAAEYAGTQGVTIVLENEAHDESATPASVQSIVEAVGSPHFGTQYDPCNYYHAYEEPYPAAYEVLKDHIRYVHLKGGIHYDPRWCDRPGSPMRGKEDRFIGYVPIPESAFNVDTILRRLAQDGYAGYITLEPHVPPEKVIDFYRIEVPYVQARLNSASLSQ